MKYITKSFLCSIIGVGVLAFLAVHCATAPNLFYDAPVKAYQGCIQIEAKESPILSMEEPETISGKPCTWEEIKEQGSAGCGYPTLAIQHEEEERIEKYCRELYLDIQQ